MLCGNDLADMLHYFARAFAVSASRPILDAAQLPSRIVCLVEPTLDESKDLLSIVEQEHWKRRVEE
jgi:hypothetical protein